MKSEATSSESNCAVKKILLKHLVNYIQAFVMPLFSAFFTLGKGFLTECIYSFFLIALKYQAATLLILCSLPLEKLFIAIAIASMLRSRCATILDCAANLWR